jgi:hypothetical protein
MEYIHFDLPFKSVSIYPLGDWHYGSPQSKVAYIQKVVKLIQKDLSARWFGHGDLIENALIGTPGDIYTQLSSPEKQIEEVIKMLMPIKDQGLFMLSGNHEDRSEKSAGLSPTAHIASALRVRYVEYSCLFTLDLQKSGGTPRSFSCYAHHNTGGGYTAGGKVNAAAKLRLICPTVDATFTAHVHTTGRTPVTWFEPGYKKALRKTGYDYIIGATLTWDKSYAERRAKRPSTVEHIKVTFVGSTNNRKDNRKQIFEVISDGD